MDKETAEGSGDLPAGNRSAGRNKYADFALRSRRWVLLGLLLAAAAAAVVTQLR